MAYRELVFTVSEDLAEDLGDALMELDALSISVSDAAADTGTVQYTIIATRANSAAARP
jgi:ribosomal protein L11 methylase PrmA